MDTPNFRHASRGAGWALAVCGLGLAVGSAADAAPTAPFTQAADRGSLRLPLHRGGFVPFEATILATPDDCSGPLDLALDWDQAKNQVRVRLRGERALTRAPSVDRQLGVDYQPNPWFAEPEDIDGGRYQLWIVGAGGPMWEFWYDPETLALIGAGPDFSPPVGAIALRYPTFHVITSPVFEPSASGRVRLDWSFPYDSAHRGDRPEYAHHTLAFVPPDLCHLDPWRVDQTTLRPFVSPAYARDEARHWSDYTRGGLLFEIVVVPDDLDPADPPPLSLVATHSGATVAGSGVPEGWALDLDAAFAGLAPPIVPWVGRDRCQAEFAGFHVGANVCEPN